MLRKCVKCNHIWKCSYDKCTLKEYNKIEECNQMCIACYYKYKEGRIGYERLIDTYCYELEDKKYVTASAL